MATSEIGLVGLAVMGQNLSLNVAEKGFPISVYNRSYDKTEAAVARAQKEGACRAAGVPGGRPGWRGPCCRRQPSVPARCGWARAVRHPCAPHAQLLAPWHVPAHIRTPGCPCGAGGCWRPGPVDPLDGGCCISAARLLPGREHPALPNARHAPGPQPPHPVPQAWATSCGAFPRSRTLWPRCRSPGQRGRSGPRRCLQAAAQELQAHPATWRAQEPGASHARACSSGGRASMLQSRLSHAPRS
jgi:hypothetical protein